MSGTEAPDVHASDRSILLRRLGAYAADVTLLFLVLAPVGYLLQGAIGVSPDTPREVYATLLLNFSLPAWSYFALADASAAGATVGKRLVGIRTERDAGGRVGHGRAWLRTTVKMVPWEVTHASAFLLAPALGQFGLASWIGIGAAYVLLFAYLLAAWRTAGSRSLHDRVASTRVTATGR